ncbi:MAG: hypothetical protein KJ734_08760, partial [Chloroflexi bacterium]|nr:hypothetical protein [Chloroflexota bacterium]
MSQSTLRGLLLAGAWLLLLAPAAPLALTATVQVRDGLWADVQGHTDPGNTVMVNSQAAPVDRQGHFTATASLRPGPNYLLVVARDGQGREQHVILEATGTAAPATAAGEGLALTLDSLVITDTLGATPLQEPAAGVFYLVYVQAANEAVTPITLEEAHFVLQDAAGRTFPLAGAAAFAKGWAAETGYLVGRTIPPGTAVRG